MNNNSLIIRNSIEKTDENTIKSETTSYCNITGAQRTVSQTFIQPTGQAPSKFRKIIRDISYPLPKIAIKKEDDPYITTNSEIVLVNGCWDISNKIPNIVAEMHNFKTEELHTLQNTCNNTLKDTRSDVDYTNPSPRGSDSGIESDCADGNLSWLLNYRINELPPVPDEKLDNSNSIIFPFLGDDLLFSAKNQPPDGFIKRFDGNNSSCRFVENKNQNSCKDASRATNHGCRYFGPKKPPFTYTELIEHALNEKGELTVSGIYQWISEHFPFYKQNDDRWKNSVRHNLSINPHFRKGSKAVHGAGHLWTIAQRDDKKSLQIKQRMQQFIQTNCKKITTHKDDDFDLELQAATTSILREAYDHDPETNVEFVECGDNTRNKKQNIQVEYINVIDVTNGLEDFLSPPVSKQQLVQECGLGNDFLITDLNPNTLGINLSEAETINEEAIYNDISLEYYELQK